MVAVASLKIALVGMPGSGKSTVGKHLARRLRARFVDSDHAIEDRLGCSVREFFEREGEVAFRDLEEEVIRELVLDAGCVISTGGGAILRPGNLVALRDRVETVYLHAAPEDIFHRLRNDQSRPLLQVADPLSRLWNLYLERDPLYRQAARFVVETNRQPVSMLVKTVMTQLELAGVIEKYPG